jgi:hypothetical protein
MQATDTRNIFAAVNMFQALFFHLDNLSQALCGGYAVPRTASARRCVQYFCSLASQTGVAAVRSRKVNRRRKSKVKAEDWFLAVVLQLPGNDNVLCQSDDFSESMLIQIKLSLRSDVVYEG